MALLVYVIPSMLAAAYKNEGYQTLATNYHGSSTAC